jgi:hydrogenase nickel incorporation protein HypA/HybF
MHELSLMRNVVGVVSERARGRAVSVVRLRIGKLSGVDVRALRFCFDACVDQGALKGARLEVDEVEGRGECGTCGRSVALEQPVLRCSCAEGARLRVTQGDEVMIASMEVDDV